MSERTPTPYRMEWEEEFDTFHHGVIQRYPVGIKGANNCWIVRFDDDYGTNQALDAEFIVRAANSHEQLLTLAKAVLEYKQRRGYVGAGFEDLVWLASEAVTKANKGERSEI